MKSKLSIIVLPMILLSGCTKIMLYHFGVRNPKVENKTQIEYYLKKNKLNVDNCYALKDTAILNKFNNGAVGIPEIRFYDKNGYLMLYRDNKKCNAQNDSLISFLDPKNIVKIDSANKIDDCLKELKTLDGKEMNIEEFKHYDYYLIMYWAKWTGQVNSKKMTDWENSLKQKNDLKIKTIKVTTDYMDFWELNKKDMAKIYSRKTKIKDKKKQRQEK